jgi:hypothetical protein
MVRAWITAKKQKTEEEKAAEHGSESRHGSMVEVKVVA